MPQNVREHRLFTLVSITAGICEELIYRGFVMWVLSTYTGVWTTALLQAVVFAVIALAAGSLVPGMVAHAIMDAVSGDIGLRVHQAAQEQDQYLGTPGSTRLA